MNGAGRGSSEAINTTTYTIRGLAELHTYYVQIHGGDDTQGDDFDIYGYQLRVDTPILRTTIRARTQLQLHDRARA